MPNAEKMERVPKCRKNWDKHHTNPTVSDQYGKGSKVTRQQACNGLNASSIGHITAQYGAQMRGKMTPKNTRQQ